MNKPTPSPATAKDEQVHIYYMFACKAIYENPEKVIRQRELNVLITSEVQNLNRESLGHIQRSATQRICTEHGVTPDAVKDIILLSCFPLGVMTQSEFLGKQDETATEPRQ